MIEGEVPDATAQESGSGKKSDAALIDKTITDIAAVTPDPQSDQLPTGVSAEQFKKMQASTKLIDIIAPEKPKPKSSPMGKEEAALVKQIYSKPMPAKSSPTLSNTK